MRLSLLLTYLTLSQIHAAPYNNSTVNIFVNGGDEAITNYTSHEILVKGFYNDLFSRNGQIFDGNGPGTEVIPIGKEGTLMRNQLGRIQLRKTDVDFPTEPAMKANILSTFDKLKANPPRRITIGWDDHGGDEAICLWGGGRLSQAELKTFYNGLPKSTLIRSIHLHCHGGAQLVNRNRKVPESPEAFEGFMKAEYPTHACGIALSLEDELTMALWYGDNWSKSPWHEPLTKRGVHLRHLKSRVASSLQSTPVLTSDYFIKDVLKMACAFKKKIKPAVKFPSFNRGPASTRESSASRQGASSHAEPPANRARKIVSVDFCIETEQQKLLRLKDIECKGLTAKSNDYTRLKNKVISLYLKEKHSDIEGAYRVFEKEKDNIKADYLLKLSKSSMSLEEENEFRLQLEALRTQEVLEFELLQSNIRDGYIEKPALVAFQNSTIVKQFLSGPDIAKRYPTYAKFRSGEYAGKTILEINRDLNRKERVCIDQRIKLRTQEQFTARNLAENWMNEQSKIKEHYEVITRCETSSLN